MKRLIAALILLLPLQALAADYPAKVVGITDGDMIRKPLSGQKATDPAKSN